MALYDIPLTLLANIQIRAADREAAAALVSRFVDGFCESAGDGFLDGWNSDRAPGVGLVEGFTGCDIEGLNASLIDAEVTASGWVVEAQRDEHAGSMTAGTWMVPCDDARATSFGVFTNEGSESELVEDYPTRAAAEEAVRALEVGDPIPTPVWPEMPVHPLAVIADGCVLLDGVNDATMDADNGRVFLHLADGRVLRVTAEVVGG